MKGWRPSLAEFDAGSGSFAGEFLAGHRIDQPVFFRGSPGLWSRDPGSLSRSSGSAAARSGNGAHTSAIMKKAPTLHLARNGKDEPEMKTRDD
jgi:hypothetical protein